MNLTPRKLAGLALLLVALGLGIAGWVLAQRPALYAASATLKVERDQVDLPKLADFPETVAAAAAGVNDDYFIQTELALIQSEATLGKVVERLDLNEVWGNRLNHGGRLKSSESLQMLKSRLHLQPHPGLANITITAYSELATEAADLANAAGRAYADYRADYRRRLAQTALDAIAGKHAEMEQQVARARSRVAEAEQQVPAELKAKLGERDESTGTNDPLRGLHTRYADCLLRYLACSNQLALFQSKNDTATELLEELKARADKAKTDLLTAEAATREEMKKQEKLQNYRVAREEMETLEQVAAPLRRTVDGLNQDLQPRQQSPAQIIEAATPPTVADTREADRGKAFLAVAGVLAVFGLALLFTSSATRISAT